MKKKVFSKLLMVALVATVGAFTSCKDYDDDINDLRSKVDGLNTSLTTLINDKVTTVTAQVNALEKQLKDVETAYAQADAALQKELDAAKETGKANADAIKTLQGEVVNLQTAKGQLEEAVKALQDGLATANTNIKANGDEIIKLIAADKALEDKIATAQAAAENALKEAQAAQTKAGENATEIASLKTKEQADFENLQKQISDNLTTVNAKIAEVNKALGDRITVNETDIKALQDASTEYKADIKTIKDKVKALEDSDKEILVALDEAKKTLEKADADAAAAQKEVNDKLAAEIKANADAIDLINHVTLRDLEDKLVDEVIPAEVLKQLNFVLTYRLKKFFDEEVTTLVATETGKNKALIDALDEKVDSIDEAINNYVDAQFLLVAAAMDSIADAHDTKAGEIITAYQNADNLVKDSVGKVAAALETAKTTLGNRITTLDEQINGKGEAKGIVGQIATLEEWFAPAAAAEGQQASGLLKYQEELLKSEVIIAKINDIVDAANNEINEMITSINLFAGPHEDYHSSQGGTGYREFDHNLNFTYAIEYETVFPEPDLQKYVDDSIKFTEGYLHTYADSILVRVSPVNAVLDKSLVALINSQGEDIVASGVVNVDGVEKYNRPAGEYLTRATNNGETGLWVIKFSLKDKDPEVWKKFKAAAYPKLADGTYNETKKILYSVGVKNTNVDDAEDNRYVVSEYDLGLGTSKAYHVWDYDVNETVVQKIHNRYIVNENKPNSQSAAKLWTDDKEKFPQTYNEELTYAPYMPYVFTSKANYPDGIGNECYGNIGSFVKENGEYVLDLFGEKVVYDYPGYIYQDLKKKKAADDEALTFNVTDRWGYTIDHRDYTEYYGYQGIDNRDNQRILTVNFDGDWATINIEFPRVISCTNSMSRSTEIGGFYVMLDQNFARESSTSEVSAWTQYIYEGVGFRSVNGFDEKTGQYIYDETRNDEQAGIENGIRKATLFKGNKGAIKIKNARGAKGDVIGFRVFAVNLDGTLYDPDGRAFYVKVGDESVNRTLNFEVKVFNEAGDTATQNEDIVAFNQAAAAATPKEDPFFNMTQIEKNKGSKYYYKWTWTEEDANGNEVENDVVRRSSTSNSAWLPLEATTDYLTELFQFWYTDEETVKENTVWTKMLPSASKTQYTGEVPVNNVAVELLDADRLLDGGTYHLKLEVTKIDPDGAESLVNTIFVNVKKIMPNRPPKAFMLRDVQKKNVTFYMRPKGDPDKTNIWSISSWFNANEKMLASANYKNYGFDYNYKVDGKSWTERDKEVYGISGQQARTTRATIPSYDSQSTDYRWATDVRPYNFEEIFHGLITKAATAAVNNNPAGNYDAYIAQFDKNYSFYFPGCGSYKMFYAAGNVENQLKAVKDTAVTYFRTDPNMSPQNMEYKGLNTDKNAIVDRKMPGYYLPYIYYENVKEDTKGVEVPVMVAYTYRNISFKQTGVDAWGDPTYEAGDYTTKPTYFKANGDATDKAGAEFKVKFECAIDPTFAITTMKDSVRAYDASDALAAGINGTAVNGKTKNHDLSKSINYGNMFEVSFDSLTVTWTSDKEAMETADNKAASFFRTNFAEFAQNKAAGKFPTTESAVYADTCWIWAQNYGNLLWDNAVTRTAPHIRIVNADKQPAIEDIELYIYETKDTEGNGTPADVAHYFDVYTFASPVSDTSIGSQTAAFGTKGFGKFGLRFISKSTSLDPTKIHRMRLVVKSSAPTLVHQWGHSKAGTQTTREIWIKNPASTPNLSRRTR